MPQVPRSASTGAIRPATAPPKRRRRLRRLPPIGRPSYWRVGSIWGKPLRSVCARLTLATSAQLLPAHFNMPHESNFKDQSMIESQIKCLALMKGPLRPAVLILKAVSATIACTMLLMFVGLVSMGTTAERVDAPIAGHRRHPVRPVECESTGLLRRAGADAQYRPNRT